MKKKTIAIIGSGISGISASLFLSQKYNIHLFENDNIQRRNQVEKRLDIFTYICVK